jgi:TldD protein
MFRSRRTFLKASGAVVGAAALPSWVLEREAAEAAGVDRAALADVGLRTAKSLGADYADVRINRNRSESIMTREAQVQQVQRTQSFGFGVRVMVGGTWGFAASRSVTAGEVRRVTALAVEIAKANAAHQRRAITLVPAPKAVASWKSAFKKDPFDVPLEAKIQLLLGLNEVALGVPGVAFVNSSVLFVNEQKFFASSEGSRIEQYVVRTSPQLSATAVDRGRGDFQQRRTLGGPQGMGYEYLEEHDWRAEAEQAGREAALKLTARSVEPGTYDLVLDPSHLWLTIHESVGHSTELDRALGWEADYAGTSFLTPDKTGAFTFGSKAVSFFADRTQPHGLATVAYDDDGVPAQRWYLVKDGVFVDWQTTRDTAGLVGRKSSYGCGHADSWGSVPFPRMPNVSLEAAKDATTLEELIGGVESGILILGDGSFSIDQQRYNFQFGGQSFWEIKDGRKGQMLRDVAYQARTPEFWGACDGVGGEAGYRLGGSFSDGKGQPSQSNAVSHGCPPARFRRIAVLNTAVGSPQSTAHG